MSSELKLRRGSTVAHTTFTGADGEVTLDTDKNVIVSHDGVTVGGFPHTKAADLAAPNGAALVTYLPSGTGAIASTVQSKLRESVSVKDFGAVGDGVTDDTAAFQEALALPGNHTVFVPPSASNYIISDTLVINSGVSLIGSASNPGGVTLELLPGVNVPLIWVKGAFASVENLSLFDGTAYDSVRDSWRVGVEVCTNANWNCVFVSIKNITGRGFYDIIHVSQEADSLRVDGVVGKQYTNSIISFERNRGAPALPAAPSSAVSIKAITGQENQHPTYRPLKIDASGVLSHDRYGLYLTNLAEATVSNLIINTPVVPIYLGVDTYLSINDALVEPTYFTTKVFSAASLDVVTGDVIEFANGQGTSYLYRAMGNGTLTTKTGWGTTTGGTFTIDGVSILCAAKVVGLLTTTAGYTKAALTDVRISRKTCFSLNTSNQFRFTLCREFGASLVSWEVGDQTSLFIDSCYFPSSPMVMSGNRYLRVINSEVSPLQSTKRYAYDSQKVMNTSYDASVTTYNASAVVNNYNDIIRLTGTAAQTISTSKAASYSETDYLTSGKITTFVKTSGTTNVINISGFPLVAIGDSVSALSRLGEPNLIFFNYSRKQLSGTTANRPSLAANHNGYMYHDTTLNKPIWWNGTVWTDATGTTA